jgi:hypothetical protein
MGSTSSAARGTCSIATASGDLESNQALQRSVRFAAGPMVSADVEQEWSL